MARRDLVIGAAFRSHANLRTAGRLLSRPAGARPCHFVKAQPTFPRERFDPPRIFEDPGELPRGPWAHGGLGIGAPEGAAIDEVNDAEGMPGRALVCRAGARNDQEPTAVFGGPGVDLDGLEAGNNVHGVRVPDTDRSDGSHRVFPCVK